MDDDKEWTFSPGVTHGDELFFQFPIREAEEFRTTVPTETEHYLQKAIIKLWGNFVKTGWVWQQNMTTHSLTSEAKRMLFLEIQHPSQVICPNGIQWMQCPPIIIASVISIMRVDRWLQWNPADFLKNVKNFGVILTSMRATIMHKIMNCNGKCHFSDKWTHFLRDSVIFSSPIKIQTEN